MKPLGISTEFIYPGRVGGAEHYTKNLIEGLLKVIGKDDGLKLFGASSAFHLTSPFVSNTESGLNFGNRFIRETWSYLRNGKQVRGIIFPNYFTPPLSKSCQIVTVIHDAQYVHLPQNFSTKKKIWLKFAHYQTLNKADTVVATSEFVKNDLLEIYGTKWETKIKVIPIPVSWERFGDPHPKNNTSSKNKFILSVAAHYPHKNLSTLIKSFKIVQRSYPNIKLVLAGQLPQNLIGSRKGPDLWRLVDELGLQDAVHITGYISNKELATLYQTAELMVFPSLFEGFGLPPVEALGFGLPVITTALASIPEITLGMGRYLKDPLDCEEMAKEICLVLSNPSAYRIGSDKILKIREQYNPTSIAKKYYEFFI